MGPENLFSIIIIATTTVWNVRRCRVIIAAPVHTTGQYAFSGGMIFKMCAAIENTNNRYTHTLHYTHTLSQRHVLKLDVSQGSVDVC
jgi:hypothetical protein